MKILISKIDNDNTPSLSTLTNFLISLQSGTADLSSKGGFYEEFFKSVFKWKKRLRVNSWGSMFALQALYWNDNSQNITFDDEIQLLF